jgi:hypothetical protein
MSSNSGANSCRSLFPQLQSSLRNRLAAENDGKENKASQPLTTIVLVLPFTSNRPLKLQLDAV